MVVLIGIFPMAEDVKHQFLVLIDLFALLIWKNCLFESFVFLKMRLFLL
jgi:hypothetical protein